jgi:hypothetical protein
MSVFNNLENTNMTVSVIDKNKCTASFTYQPFDPMLVIPAAQNAACDANGKINVTVTGGNQPYQYSLNNVDFQSSPDFENLEAGTYTVTVKDAFDCTASAETTIEREEYEISLSVTSENPTCGADGIIKMEATGGRDTYQYSIDGGSTWGSNSTLDDLCPGTYGPIKVKDAGGCEATAESITLTAPEFIELVTPDGPPVVAVTDPQARAAADEDGVIIISYKGKEYRVKVPKHEKVPGTDYDIKVNNIVYTPLFIECSETFAGYYRVDCPDGSGELSKKEDFEGVNCIGNLPLKYNGKDVYKDCWLDDTKIDPKLRLFVRHFIPENRDGYYAYRGDGRGFSCTPNDHEDNFNAAFNEFDDGNWETHSSRVIIRGQVDFSGGNQEVMFLPPYCDFTVLLGLITKAADPEIISETASFLSDERAGFIISYIASDPLALGLAPVLNYDFQAAVEYLGSLNNLRISYELLGDPYPAGEVFIVDQNSNKAWFLDTYSIPGTTEIIASYPENKDVLIDGITYFKVNPKSGSIIGAFNSTGQLISSNHTWNSTFKLRNTRK